MMTLNEFHKVLFFFINSFVVKIGIIVMGKINTLVGQKTGTCRLGCTLDLVNI